ncbi:MAG: cytochrome c peroxidase [Methylomonas sp.]|jgi:cytochrome c peroxidase
MTTINRNFLFSLALCGCLHAAVADDNTPDRQPSALQASYSLPVIGPAGDGKVLTIEHQATTLHRQMDDKLVLLSFIYTACSDVNGCPLATQILNKIARQLQKQPEIAAKLRLLTLSFNPLQDTPEVMQRYGAGLAGKMADWRFLTCPSEQQLQPILESYPQNIEKILDSKGQFTGTYTHLLRVYLIDAKKQIRAIYNMDFLNADTILADVRSLLTPAAAPKINRPVNPEQFYRPGDDKLDYQHNDYQTHSLALTQRLGHTAALLNFALHPPLGLPKLPQPADNPLSAAKISLGRKLFYDRRLSFNNTFSCAMCHIPEQGFTNNELATPIGVEGRSIRRNAPSLYNSGHAQLLFHDGRENRLEQQAWGPLLAHNEMANPSIAFVIGKIQASNDYKGLFEKAFHKPAGMETIGQALAAYQRCLNSADSAFDRWLYGKQTQALDGQAQRGYRLFAGKAGCSQCHLINEKSALFTDQQRHNTGIGYRDTLRKIPEQHHVQLAPGVSIDVTGAQFAGLAPEQSNDLGYYEISQDPKDRWAYKTPSLRNVALTAPYMHNGSLATLREVVEFYNQGGVANENLSPLIKPLGLSAAEIDDLTAFLMALTGGNVADLVADGFAAPVGDKN